jgi:NAD(P)-dependent dehydrogenase (short-subunit alcohol dehydrogenase family)
MSNRSLQGRTVVVSGASSGVGRAIAEAFAAEGCRLVLAARGPEGLNRVAETCRTLDADVLTVPTDITDPDAVEMLAARAVQAFGRIDVWVSTVGIGAVGRFDETPMEAHEQVIRANLLGHMYEAHAALPVFIGQKSGTFINIVSLGGYVAAPYATAYTASKFALRGFGEALRAELRAFPHIHVCDVFPTFVDTPGLQHAANYVGRRLTAPPPVGNPLAVAHAVVRLASRPRAKTLVGTPARLGRLAHMVAPDLTADIGARVMEAWFRRAAPAPMTEGNLYEPSSPAGRVFGGLRYLPEHRGMATLAGAALIAGTGVALVALSRRRHKSVEGPRRRTAGARA